MKTITVIGQGFTGAIMSIVCARAIKKKKTLYKVYGLEKIIILVKKLLKI